MVIPDAFPPVSHVEIIFPLSFRNVQKKMNGKTYLFIVCVFSNVKVETCDNVCVMRRVTHELVMNPRYLLYKNYS